MENRENSKWEKDQRGRRAKEQRRKGWREKEREKEKEKEKEKERERERDL